jgi:hypothetical protein
MRGKRSFTGRFRAFHGLRKAEVENAVWLTCTETAVNNARC